MPSSVLLLYEKREVGSLLWASVSSCAKGGWVLLLKEPSTPALSDSHRGPPFGPHRVSGPTCASSGLRPGLARGSLGASLVSVPPASPSLSKLLPQHFVQESVEHSRLLASCPGWPWALVGPVTEGDPIWGPCAPRGGGPAHLPPPAGQRAFLPSPMTGHLGANCPISR